MEIQYCQHCGARINPRWEKLTGMLVKILVRFYATVHETNRNDLHVSDELGLTHTEYNNFQKLRFHALVAKTGETGRWLITHRGAEFVKGLIKVPRAVQVMRNTVVDHSPELLDIRGTIKDNPYLEKKEDYSPDYTQLQFGV